MRKLGVSRTRLLWFIKELGIQKDPDYFKEIQIGKTSHQRYSKPCYEFLQTRLQEVNLDEMWDACNAAS